MAVSIMRRLLNLLMMTTLIPSFTAPMALSGASAQVATPQSWPLH